ncbi:SCO family protein [Thioclava sp. GXIMD4215]|uniref:SCO family protein n=1 Tax=Thioclava sp. GXIMD4215 TaxID=3131928 RepID=UPI003246589C
MSLSPKVYAILGAVIVVGGIAIGIGMTRNQPADAFAQCRAKPAAGHVKLGGPFTLTSETGETVTDQQVFTKPSLLYFGYTYCPDVCPLDSMRNAQATDILDEQGYDVQPVFVSVDSARDTPASVAAFTDVMSPKMLGLVGTPEQIKMAAKAYRVLFSVQNPDDPYTLISHSTQTYLVLPKLGYVDYFDRDTTPEEMAERVSCYIDHANAE